jgi:hypothetical protein
VNYWKPFGNYTVDLHAIADWLSEHKIKTVAMESTGVYWIPLFEVLEQKGFECLLTPALHPQRGASVRFLKQGIDQMTAGYPLRSTNPARSAATTAWVRSETFSFVNIPLV